MAITIPRVRNKHGASVADVIIEQIALCKANLESIERIAKYRKPREKMDEIRRRLRASHDFLGMAGSRKDGCLYREIDLPLDEPVVCEHAIPVTGLASLYEVGTPFEELAFYPVARISKKSDNKFRSRGLVKSGYDLVLPFKRYDTVDIRIETHEGIAIDCRTWTMQNHWSLVEKTKELASIRDEVLSKLQRLKMLVSEVDQVP